MAPDAIIGLGRSFGHIVTGIAGIVNAFAPFVPSVVGGVEKATSAFSEWGQQLKSNPEFINFMAKVQELAPQVWQVIKDLAAAILNVAKAVAPLGVAAFSGLGFLADVVAGMDPGTIQAIAIAIGAVKLALMGMRAASALAAIPGRLSDIGDAANKAKTKVGGLGDRLGDLGSKIGLGGAVGGLGLTAGLIALENEFAKAAEASDRFTEKVVAAAGTDLDAQIAALNAEIKKQRDLMGPNIAGWIYFTESGQAAGDAADRMEKEIATLTHQKEIAALQAKATGKAYGEMGGAVDAAKKQFDGLEASLDKFSGRTDALKATQAMTSAYKEAKKAISEASGQLGINARMTDAQRDAVIRAREQFGGFLTSVRAGADAQKELKSHVFAATEEVLRQLPQMLALAGKNSEAKNQVLELARAYGISREDAIKAAKGGRELRDVIEQLKSKTLHIDADTAKADAAIGRIIQTLNKTYVIGVDVRSDLQEHGARAKAAGGIERMATGGIRSMVRPIPPMIATSPTILFGEGSSGRGAKEAYISFEKKYAGRSLGILQQVAAHLGQQLIPATSGGSIAPVGPAMAGIMGSTRYHATSNRQMEADFAAWEYGGKGGNGGQGGNGDLNIETFIAQQGTTPRQIVEALSWQRKARRGG